MSFPFVPFQFNLSRNNSQQSFPPSYIFNSLNFFLATQSPSIKIIPRNSLSNNTNSSYLSLSLVPSSIVQRRHPRSKGKIRSRLIAQRRKGNKRIVEGINSHRASFSLSSSAFFTHFPFYEREKQRERKIQHVTRRKSREPDILWRHTNNRAVLLEKRKRKERGKKERKIKKKKYICVASVLSVLEEQLVLQGLANNEPEIQRKKKKPGFNYALYHRNKTNLDTYKSDVTTNDVFLRIRMKLSQLA